MRLYYNLIILACMIALIINNGTVDKIATEFFGSPEILRLSATHYSGDLTGEPMAWNDIPYDPLSYTCAIEEQYTDPLKYPFGTLLAVTYEGRTVFVTVTDLHDGRTELDLSFFPFVDLVKDYDRQGRIDVKVEVVKEVGL